MRFVHGSLRDVAAASLVAGDAPRFAVAGTAAGRMLRPGPLFRLPRPLLPGRVCSTAAPRGSNSQPGATYEVRGEAHGWVHVAGHGVEDWVPASSVRRFTT